MNSRAETVILWIQRLLFVTGVLLLSYCAFLLADAWIFQRRAREDFDRRQREAAAGTAPPASVPTVGSGGLIGRIDIPRIGLSAVIFEGTGKITLRRAVGHISDTPLPGQRGNSGLAGHRDSFFRPLKDVRLEDVIAITTLNGEYRYRVVSTRVVKPTEVSVLDDSGAGEVLTLVTCHPFRFTGAAPNRFIVRARRLDSTARLRNH